MLPVCPGHGPNCPLLILRTNSNKKRNRQRGCRLQAARASAACPRSLMTFEQKKAKRKATQHSYSSPGLLLFPAEMALSMESGRGGGTRGWCCAETKREKEKQALTMNLPGYRQHALNHKQL
eukprot:1162062-Pelagomonas_calceolata.AAC.26